MDFNQEQKELRRAFYKEYYAKTGNAYLNAAASGMQKMLKESAQKKGNGVKLIRRNKQNIPCTA